ncbi:hypothetical protein G3554_14585 [Micromonospora sp. PPF5-17]|uniref:Thioredoxin domain-containing protein n=1 Tax=Micromonospora solifontis TaxID=2487138 RepID=A0ABX9WEV6_9ACTN|nr:MULTISPECIES: hypothetical protein [Micromonospora]NES37382.1 hypothetical protein [Micromonospora solifontis]NES58073.1 hypothetical protein [Micromonospora sp. PPF5-6]RNL98390.1 hypothetical protein EFE23_14625 [Micromonospora solifontis]
MPGFAYAAVAVIGAVAVLNLVLTLALARRLREVRAGHTHDGEPIPEVLPAPGLDVSGFPHADLAAGRRTVVMLTPTCPPCQDVLDALTGDADRYRHDALVLMIGTPAETAAMAPRLAGFDTVTVSESLAEKEFRVKGFPAVLSVVDGVVVDASHQLPVLA